MKASHLKTLLLVGLTGFSAIGAKAQPAPKIAVVDLAKLFDGFWETKTESDKINGERQAAQNQACLLYTSRCV